MINYKLTIQYDGTRYAGWQTQANAITIQEVISSSIRQILQQEINLTGSGRTDSGVHALGQVANFSFSRELDLFKFRYSLNSILPEDIAVIKIEQVDENFNSRFSARKRQYLYLISNQKSPFYDRYSYTLFAELNPEKLNSLSDCLVGVQDFSSFSKINPDVQNKVCEVYTAKWRQQKNFLIFSIEANRFIYGMVRCIVGTLLKAHSMDDGQAYLKDVILKKDRFFSADSVTAKGLFLYRVKY